MRSRERLGWMLALAIGAVGWLATAAHSDDEPAPRPLTPEQEARVRAAIMPGPEHKRLAALAGEWDTVTRVWMQPGAKDAQPMISKGRSRNEMVLGGRFLMTRNESTSAMGKFESIGMYGFDRRSDRYTTVGFDSMGTYYVTASGTHDEKTNTTVLKGTDPDPITGHTQKYRFEIEHLGPDEYVVSVIFTDSMHTHGKVPEFKMVEVTCNRRR